MKQYTSPRRSGLIRLAAGVLFSLNIASAASGIAPAGSGMIHGHPPGAFRYPPGILTPDSSPGRPMPSNPAAKTGGKDIALQPGVGNHPDFSWNNTAQSDNFIIFWGKNITGHPTDSRNGELRFNPTTILETLEDILVYMTDSIGFIDNADQGNMSRYKHEVVMNETWTDGAFRGWAFGGWVRDGLAGGMWVHPRAAANPGLLAHEFTHACQAMIMVQYPGFGLNASYAGFFWESHAEFIRARYTGSYQATDIARYINTSMQHYSTTRRYYQNLYFLDYLSDTYGFETTNLIWRRANPHFSHPLTALRDFVLGYSQSDLNDDFLRHAMKNVTWDYHSGSRIRHAIGQASTGRIGRTFTFPEFLNDDSGRMVPPAYMAPGDYGYNIIPLFPEPGATEVRLEFESIPNEAAGGGGNRYGFVAVDESGTPRYSKVFHGSQPEAVFPVFPSDGSLFLVVTGAPQTHHNYGWETGLPHEYRYPYSIRLEGALPAGHKQGYNSRKHLLPGQPHPNGGGWVASTASVAQTAFVGPYAQVLDQSSVEGNARIEGHAMLTGSARVDGEAVVRDNAIVGTTSRILDHAVVSGSARVYASTLRGHARATGYALLYHSSLDEEAMANDLAWLEWVDISGSAVIGGNAEGYNGCDEGMYLQDPVFVRTSGCDGQVDHPLNADVNPDWDIYHHPLGNKPAAPQGLQAEKVAKYSVGLAWEKAESHAEVVAYYVIAGNRLMGMAEEPAVSVVGLQPGRDYGFTVRAVDRHGRFSPHSNQVVVSTIDGHVPEEWLTENLKTYPNPSDGLMTIKLEEGNMDRLQVFNVSGGMVFDGSPSTNTLLLDKAAIGRGLFLIRVVAGEEVMTTRIVFQ